MSSEESRIDLDSDDGDVHPNIDEKSYREWRRRQKEQARHELEKRLLEISAVEAPSEELADERRRIEDALRPSYVCVETASFRTPSGTQEKDYVPELEHLIRHSDLDSFIELMERREIDMEDFECLVLHNLAEQIKERNDAGGLILSRISLYTKYALSHGKEFLLRLRAQLTNKEKKRLFEEDCRKDFEETKRAFLQHFES